MRLPASRERMGSVGGTCLIQWQVAVSNRWIDDSATLDAGEAGPAMASVTAGSDDVLDWVTMRYPCVSDQRAMAPPRDGLSTHDRRAQLARCVDQAVNRDAELVGLHVVGIGAEAGISPAHISPSRGGAFADRPTQRCADTGSRSVRASRAVRPS